MYVPCVPAYSLFVYTHTVWVYDKSTYRQSSVLEYVVSDESAKPKGPASYFPSIEKKYGQPIAYWLAILDGMRGKAHMEMVNELKTTYAMGHGHANALVAYYRAQQDA